MSVAMIINTLIMQKIFAKKLPMPAEKLEIYGFLQDSIRVHQIFEFFVQFICRLLIRYMASKRNISKVVIVHRWVPRRRAANSRETIAQ